MSVFRSLSFVLVLLLAAGCQNSPQSADDADMDAMPAQDVATDDVRYVTMGGAVTELVYAYGLGDQVVGVDLSSSFPPAVRELPQLGYFRQSSAEGVISLNPTHVLASSGIGPEGVVEQIEQTGIEVIVFPEADTFESALARARAVGEALNRPDSAEAVVARMQAGLEAARGVYLQEPPRALFIYARGAGLVNVGGTNTSADEIIRLAGGVNAVTAFEGFRPLTAEAMVEASPDFIVLPARGLESLGGIDGLLQQPGVAQTPAGQNRAVIGIDDALLLGFGPRVGQGIEELARSFATTDTRVAMAQ
ncbi:MAG: hemin ABC transporter substrate-binding protein [Bacteroidota bacterium]